MAASPANGAGGLMLETVRKTWALLSPQQRGRFGLLGLLILGAGVVEIISVGAIVPFMTILMQPEKITQTPGLRELHEMLGNPGATEFASIAAIAFLLVYLVRTFYLVVVLYAEHTIIQFCMADFCRRMLKTYLDSPYSFHLAHNSAFLIRNTDTETSTFINSLLLPMVRIVTDGVPVLFVTVLLIWADPLITLAGFGLIGVVSGGFYRFVRGRVRTYGEARHHISGRNLKSLQQALGSVKETILKGCQGFFVADYMQQKMTTVRVTRAMGIIQGLPRIINELLVIVVVVSALLLTLSRNSLVEALPLLALFATAAVRILPAANRLITQAAQLNFGMPALQVLHDTLVLDRSRQDFGGYDLGTETPIRLEQNIKLENVSFAYRGSRQRAVENISLVIGKGQKVGFVGKSGSGKTTTVDILVGLLRPDSGRVLVDGEEISDSINGWRRQIGYIPQTIYLTDDSVRSNVAFGVDAIDDDAVWRALKVAQLSEFVRTLPDGLDTLLGESGLRLSGGQRQRIGIARALYNDPSVLILDEATAALDNVTERDFATAVNRLARDKTVITIAHRISTVRESDIIFIMEEGHLIEQGSYDELVAKSSAFRSLLGDAA